MFREHNVRTAHQLQTQSMANSLQLNCDLRPQVHY